MRIYISITILFSVLIYNFGIAAAQKIPIILDTDLGNDNDDNWAIATILAHPKLDLKLLITDSFNTIKKA